MHSLEAEQSVIGACMLNSKIVDELSDKVDASYFWNPANAAIWRAIMSLSGKGMSIDLVTLSEALEADDKLDYVGGMAYLAEVARSTPDWKNAHHYCDYVVDMRNRRQLQAQIESIGEMVTDRNTPFVEVVDAAQSKIGACLSVNDQEIKPVSAHLDKFVSDLDARYSGDVSPMGTSFGISDLDNLTMGMHPGQLIIGGARPKMGKTLFGMSAALACAIVDKRPCLFFSMEMQTDELMIRMIAALAQIPQDALKDPANNMRDEYWPRIGPAIIALKEAPLVIDDRPALKPSQVRGATKRWKEHYGDMGLVVADYIGLMKNDEKHGTREREVAEISGKLKGLAKEMRCPVLALSQLNRSLEARPDKRPMMSDLRESGAIEQDADIIVFLYADEQYNPDTPYKGILELIVGAQRAGRTGTVYAARRLAEARIDDLDPQALSEAQQVANAPKPKKSKSSLDF